MKVIYTDQVVPSDLNSFNSLFLIGPTPRSPDVSSWRPEALDILSRLKFNGYVFVPEWSNYNVSMTAKERCEWERHGLTYCRRLVCWVPREKQHMPAFTTNVEFGFYLGRRPKDFYYGRPFWAEECGYLDWLYHEITDREPAETLLSLLEEVLKT